MKECVLAEKGLSPGVTKNAKGWATRMGQGLRLKWQLREGQANRPGNKANLEFLSVQEG